MGQKSRNHVEDYTVGIICALPLELSAVQACLDDVHTSLPRAQNDSNTYTRGRMGSHNVAVTCLPSSKIGTNSASTVAQDMRRSFPNIKFGLLVGVGGGIPNKDNDIRLGDVVVCTGVVQYDYGKSLPDGTFERTQALSKPSSTILSALSQMQARSLQGDVDLEKHLAATNRYEVFRRPSAEHEKDRLFEANYVHNSANKSCADCDQSRVINRPDRKTLAPHIHYGTILSGNQVMKDATTRDRLASEYNGLAFEMEAAGICDDFLTIRGICDYADSHKNKSWQPYAAATAAAYAKEFISAMNPPSIRPLTASNRCRRTCYPRSRRGLVANINITLSISTSNRRAYCTSRPLSLLLLNAQRSHSSNWRCRAIHSMLGLGPYLSWLVP
jgi:nucleoside phosphorylase